MIVEGPGPGGPSPGGPGPGGPPPGTLHGINCNDTRPFCLFPRRSVIRPGAELRPGDEGDPGG